MTSKNEMKVWPAVAMVTLLWAGLYLPFLGSNELRGEEARRILPAQTMIETGDWIVPRIGGAEYASKPPLINWSIAGVFLLTGVQSEWTARLPSVLWLLGFALTATLMLRARLGDWGAVAVGLFFLSSVGMLDKGRMAEIEAMYIAQTGIAYILWAVWWSEGKRWLAYSIPWVFLGLGLLSKGPMHLGFFYGAVIPALWLGQCRRELLHPAHGVGLLLMGAVFLPWLALNLKAVEAVEETSGVWWHQLAVRFSYQNIDWGDWIQLPFEMVKNFLPWSVLLILLWRLPAPDSGEEPEANRWKWVVQGGKLVLLVSLILLSLSPGMRPRYSMPLFGVAALVLVDLVRRLPANEPLAAAVDLWWKRLNRWGWGAVMVGGVVALAVAAVWFAELAWWLALPGVLVGGGFWLWRKQFFARPNLVSSCLVLAGAQVLLFQFAGAWENKHGLYRPVAREIRELAPDPAKKLFFYEPGHLRFVFYLERPYAEVLSLKELPDQAIYLALREGHLGHDTVAEVLKQREGRELGRSEIERRKFVFFELGSPEQGRNRGDE